MSQGKQRWGEVTVIAMMVAYIIWFGFLSIRQHEAFMTGGFDLWRLRPGERGPGGVEHEPWAVSADDDWCRRWSWRRERGPRTS
jgi:hypothetical protein